MSTATALPTGQLVTLLSAVTAITTKAAVVIPTEYKTITIFIIGVGTISAGTLVIEESDNVDYAGTWSQIGSAIDLTALTGGAQQVVHIAVSNFFALQVRLSVGVTGANGSVTVEIQANR